MDSRVTATFLAGLFACLASAASDVGAQDTLHFVPAGTLAIRDMNGIRWESGPNGVHGKTIVGSFGSLTLVDVASGVQTQPHHHTRQQVDVGVSGELQFQLDTGTFTLHRGDWVVVRPDEMHGVRNRSAAPARMLELHTVRRLDLVPPHPAINWPQAAEPSHVMLWDFAHRVYDSTKFQGPMSTETSSVDVDVVRNFTIDHGDGEEFVYIVDGQGTVALAHGGAAQSIAAGNVVVIPPHTQVVLRSQGMFIVTLAARPSP